MAATNRFTVNTPEKMTPSTKQKFPRIIALDVALDLVKHLEPACHRIIIAGSIRRKKEYVSDIEILFVPKIELIPSGLFEKTEMDMAAESIERLKREGIIAQRLNKRNIATWGQQNKLAIHCSSGIPVDFFATTDANWYVSLVIRTGPKELNIQLCSSTQKSGLKLHAYGTFEDRNGLPIVAPSEEAVFSLAGVNYLPPEQRK